MNRLDRLTSILIQLQSKRVVRAQEIADRFDISLRTVYRDVRSLEVAGVPIVGEAGIGYSMLEGYRLPPVQFTTDEAAAFLTAEKLVGPYTDAGVAEFYQAGMLKLRSVLRLADKDFVEQLDNAVQVVNSAINISTEQTLPIMLRAISLKELLSIQYAGKKDEQAKQRLIEPIGVFFKNETWYTVAWCRLREDVRNFRLDRMQNVVRTGGFFENRELSLQDYLADTEVHGNLLIGTITAQKDVLNYIERQKNQQGLISEKIKGALVEMQFHTSSFEYLARWAMQFADKVVAMNPLELEATFQRILDTAQKNLHPAKSS